MNVKKLHTDYNEILGELPLKSNKNRMPTIFLNIIYHQEVVQVS